MFGLTGIYLRLAEWAVLIAFLTGAYFWIGHEAVSNYKEDQIVLQAKADKAKQEKYDKLAGDYETLKAKRLVVTNNITHEIETVVKQPIYQTQCVDQAGVDIANKALRGSLE